MKIACVGFFQGFGGAEKSLINLANNLAKRSHDVTIICLNTNEITYPIDNNIKVIYLKSNINGGKIVNIFNRFKKYKKHIKENYYDCIINFWVQPVIFQYFISKKNYGKTIYSERGNPNDKEYSGILLKMRNITFKKLDGFVFQSVKAQNMFCQKIINKSIVIYNPIFLNNKKERKEINNVIVNIGRLHEQKNQKLLLEAFGLFNKKYSDYILKIYGDGDLKESLVKLSKDLEIEDKVIFCGTTSNLHDEIIDAKMFILTSIYEGMPNALLEAMALGIPSITTDYEPKSAEEFIDNNNNGLICNKFESTELCELMLKLVEDKTLYDHISKECVEIKEDLNEKNIYDDWNRFIQEIS